MITDWKKEIAVAWLVQQETQKWDSGRVWEYHLPKIAATEQELRAVENSVGHPLDDRYRSFLRYANGWRCFYQRIDLFGTVDLIDSDNHRTAQACLASVESESLQASSLTRQSLLPIGCSSVQSDLFVMIRSGYPKAGTIIWLAGYEIDRYVNFDAFFLAMIDYNRLRLTRLSGNKHS